MGRKRVGIWKSVSMTVALTACACARLKAGEGFGVDAAIGRLSSTDVEVREKAFDELGQWVARLTGAEQKAALRKMVDVSNSHPDPQVRDKAQAVLAPYASGTAVWEIQRPVQLLLGGNVTEILPQGILDWHVGPQGESGVQVLDPRSGKPLWEKKPDGFPGRISVCRGTSEGVFVGGACDPGRAWYGVYDAKDGKVLRERILKGIGGDGALGAGLLFHEMGKDLIVETWGGRPQDGQIGRFDGETGKARWIQNTKLRLAEAPADPDRLLCIGVEENAPGQGPATSCLVYLDAATGQTVWEKRSLGSPIVKPVKEGLVVIQRGTPAKLALLDRGTGKTVWEVQLAEGVHPTVLEPAAGGVLIVAAGLQGGGSLVRLHGLEDGSVKWDLSERYPDGAAEWRLAPEGLLAAGADAEGKGWAVLLDPGTCKPVWEKKPGSLPGKPTVLQVQGREVGLAGVAGAENRNWVGIYGLSDGKARAETRLRSSDPIIGLQIGDREVVTWTACRWDKGPRVSFLVLFSLGSGEKKWVREANARFRNVRILPEGILVGAINLGANLFGRGQNTVMGLYRSKSVWEDMN